MQNKNSESYLESEIINILKEIGWKTVSKDNNEVENVLKNCTEKKLIENFRKIIFLRNKAQLNNVELNDNEMNEIISKINDKNSRICKFGILLNQKITITRNNLNDTAGYNKEVSLDIFPRNVSGGAGHNYYQIAQQLWLKDKYENVKAHRADIVLLINGLPLIQIELKKENQSSYTSAINQFKNYHLKGVYDNGLASMITLLIAMDDTQMRYFSNVDKNTEFDNSNIYLSWRDENNTEIMGYKNIVRSFLSIPAAHEMLADFIVPKADENKVLLLRSYQQHAVKKIIDKLKEIKDTWLHSTEKPLKLGYVWHTTGSGKTLTSFKLASLVMEKNLAHRVVFLVDRIELGQQTNYEYNKFIEEGEVTIFQARNTDDLYELITKNDISKKVIIASIQKGSRINFKKFTQNKLNKLIDKKILFIFDEAHRSTFGEMLNTLKDNFPSCALLGFTGTPIFKQNAKNKELTTIDVFGPEIHKYTILNGMEDEKVLKFNIETIYLKDLAKFWVCQRINNKNNLGIELNHNTSDNELNQISSDLRDKYPEFEKLWNLLDKWKQNYTNAEENKEVEKFENEFFNGIFDKKLGSDENYLQTMYKQSIVDDILKNWNDRSSDFKFGAIFAVNSIQDAIKYHKILKDKIKKTPLNKSFTVTALFDPGIDSSDVNYQPKHEEIKEIIDAYNRNFATTFDYSKPDKQVHANFKKDLSARLAHKEPYYEVNKKVGNQLDLLIVVDQMLTGFDSKYINAIYFDKLLENEHIIQAISRTNRILDKNTKQFGSAYFYRKPFQMQQRIKDAFKLYTTQDFEKCTIANKDVYIREINESFDKIKKLFSNWNINNFSRLPKLDANVDNYDTLKKELMSFANEFIKIKRNVASLKILGILLDNERKDLNISRHIFNTLSQRFLEIPKDEIKSDTQNQINYDLDYSIELNKTLAKTNTSKLEVDAKYLNNLIKQLNSEKNEENLNQIREKFCEKITIFPEKLQQIIIEVLKSNQISNYDELINLAEKRANEEEERLHNQEYINLGANPEIARKIEENNSNRLNEGGIFDELRSTINYQRGKEYLNKKKEFEGTRVDNITLETQIRNTIIKNREQK
ncbi:type I restriction enzyme R subunit [Mycoplasmopsis mustelae]|uniref:type I site-specific deoxyribonuclease n=1 Tax=Mycoplasmopsis mustelae TaxID=171289 RepID=A0A4R7UCL3_9BACT|nr:DEAD/DEAH box helicase family protein [Mycoplasmopsis mustelae]TDV24147.1 type I restriction enzyme R subunit [Mycoplasmopsis mustelae]